jgi:dolichyl-phosphate-mannose-protein mannosyltransferase
VNTRADSDFDALLVATPAADRPEAESVEVGLRIDRWWGRMLRTPARRRAWYWGGPLAVTLLAAILRFWNLGHPKFLVFDETFYVKDAWSLVHLGYEGTWPSNADASFAKGHVDIFLDSASYVVHPPLGKWLIGWGMELFGGADSVGWRFSSAVVGVLAVFALAMIMRRLTGSTVLATIAGFLFAIDGHAIVMSRVGLLDNFVMFFGLLGFWAILLDRRQSADRLAVWIAQRAKRGLGIEWGPALWWRPWLIAAGLAFGLCTAVKWSGLYFLAGLAVYTLIVDALARRRAGIAFWASGTLFKQGPVSFLLTVPIALVAYLTSWTAWFVTSDGYYRHWADVPGHAITGAFSWIPRSLQSFWYFQTQVYDFHVNEHAQHAYAANPLGWLLMLRPTSMYYLETGQDAQAITSIANPLIWWAAVAAALYLLYRLVRFREWQVGLILTGLAVGYLPWMLYLDRTVFQFYTIAFEPYLILALTFVIGILLGKRTDPSWRRLSGIRLVTVFLAFAVLLSVFWYPLWTATPVPLWFVRLHYWLPSWI